MARRWNDLPGQPPGVGHHRPHDGNGRVFFTADRDGEMMTANEPLKNVLIKNPVETWRAMKEHDREMLKRLLPEGVAKDEKWIETVVNDLFTGKVFHFDNPAERVWNQIREGRVSGLLARKRIRKELQKRNSFLILRKKHDEVVDNLDQMRKLWMRLDEETGMKERRKIWEDYLEMKAQRKKNLAKMRGRKCVDEAEETGKSGGRQCNRG